MIESTLLFGVDVLGPNAVSHAAVPVGFPFGDVLRVFVSSRDRDGRSRPYFVDLDPHTLAVLGASASPLLELGAIGTFDEHGIMPCSVVRDADGRVRLHYVGWNRDAGSVPYRVSIGCAISDDGTTFERLTPGPSLDRNPHDPIFVTTPHVTAKGEWSMLYSTADRWEEVDGRLEPFYHLARATSVDGTYWQPVGAIDISLVADAITRPTTVDVGDRTFLGFCHRQAVGYRTDRGASYKLGIAQLDGSRATLLNADLQLADDGWASSMRCYPSFVPLDDRVLMLYNGDGFGQSGVGGAWLDVDRLEPPS